MTTGFLPSPTAIHEGNHAAAMCLLGLVPAEVRTDRPSEGLAGSCSIDWGENGPDRHKVRSMLMAIVLGAMVEGHHGWDRWPIDPDNVPAGARGDAEHAAAYCHAAGIEDRASWLFIVWKANRLAKTTEFRRLAVAISEALERVEVLHADDLRRLIETTA